MEEFSNAFDGFDDLFVDNNESSKDVPFKKLNTLIDSQEFTETIKEQINVTKGQLLMMILKYAIIHCLSLTAIASLFLLFNSLFAIPILPQSRYLIDTLFNPSNNATFHANCPECGSYVGIFERSWKSVTCNLCNIEIDLKSSTYDDFFVFFDVKSQISELVQSNADYYNYIMNERVHDEKVLKDIYDGRLYQKFLKSLGPSIRHQYLTTTFNTDGAPLYESSTYSIWPIYIQVNELPMHVRTNNLIVVGLWFGKNKPDMNVFLEPFVKNMNSLSTEGVNCNLNNKEVNIKVYTLISSVDTIARAPMQGLTQFNGHFGCNWCLHPGQWVKNPRKPKSGSHKYPLIEEPVTRRNDNDTLEHMETGTESKPSFGVKNPSQLINLEKFDIIEGFVTEPMHIFSGIGQQFANTWFGTKKESSSLIPKSKLEEINSIMTKVKVPCQIGRLAGSLKDKAFWKAREWENFILYYSLPIIMLYLDKKFVLHWLLFVEAVHILLKTSVEIEELDRANKLLYTFVSDTERLYSATAMTYNLHLLLHMSTSVYNWGPLVTLSAYGFESGNGQLLKIIHAAKGVHQQVARHIGLTFSHILVKRAVYPNSSIRVKHCYDQLGSTKVKATLKLSQPRYFVLKDKVDSVWISKLQLSNEAVYFLKMVKEGCIYLGSEKINSRSDNSFILLLDGTYNRIVKFIVDRETKKEFVLLNKIKTKKLFSQGHAMFQQILKISSETIAVYVSQIDKVSVCFTVSNNTVICAAPNLLSY